LWQLEDVEIPNPNHFAASGTTGGPIGMLNNNTLRNSDFFTSAFPAEYGNVFSGVFDLNMREGNNEKYEFLGQVGFNGFELGAEGPFKKGSKSSFMANYRYSTLQVFDLLGISFGTSGIPKYQDLSFKMNFPFRNGKLSWFGLAGLSSISMFDSEENTADLYTSEGMDLENGSEAFATGLNLALFHNENTYSKFILSYVNQNGFTNMDQFDPGELPEPFYREDNVEERLTFKTIFNTKFNRKLSNRSGFTVDRYAYKLNSRIWDEDETMWEYLLNNKKSVAEGPNLYRTYSQFVYKFSDRFEIKPGIHFMYFGLNGRFSAEPRLGATWKTSPATSLNFGYGKHSKVQSMATYFIESVNSAGDMFNGGEAWNYGVEFTLEKFYHKNYYFLTTLSLFDSKYTGSDGVKRNTAFNGNFVFNTLAGREFVLSSKSTLVFDARVTWAGGNRYTPIDIEASQNTNEAFGTEYFYDLAWSEQFPNYLKADVKIGFRLDGKKVSQLWEFYVENVTNHKNPLNQTYSKSKDAIETIYQLGFFPLFNYRIYF
ncbi:MAG: hypothetical protein LC658_11525, partial [Bacteroidales bacterium]|nr:hypothetical protein [Bacteroidales bacterium]